MKRFITIFALAMLFVAPAAMAQNGYGWTISDSAIDARSNSGVNPAGGVFTYYLWLDCVTADGAAAAEFDLSSTGPNLLATTAINGFLNAGGTTDLLLATPCATGPVAAATILAITLPGEICIVPSAANGKNVSVDCTNFLEWNNDTIGYGETLGAASCASALCTVVSVEDSSWGSVKSLYR